MPTINVQSDKEPLQEAAAPEPTASQTPAMDDSVLAHIIQITATILSGTNIKETASLVVNRIGELLPMDRVALVKLDGKKQIIAVSTGTASAKDNAFADAVEEVRAKYHESVNPLIVPSQIKAEVKHKTALAKLQQSMDGSTILWLPLTIQKGEDKEPSHYAIWAERWRSVPWFKEELSLLEYIAPFFAHALERTFKTRAKKTTKRKILLSVLLAFFVILFIPVDSRIISPGRVVPKEPHYVFAPFEGIFDELKVKPGDSIKKGTVLYSYDSRVLDKRLDEALQQAEVARAELARLEGASYEDAEALGKIGVQQLEVKRAESDVAFYQDQRNRADVKSAADGVVILDDPDALIGASLQTGQLVMSIAEPNKTKYRMMVPVADAGLLEMNAPVDVRLDRDPLSSIEAKVSHIGFDVIMSDEQVPSVLAEAEWLEKPDNVQPGQRGSAKILAEKTYLGLQLFRRPLIVMREITGL